MRFLVKRKWFTEISTISELYADGIFQCYMLEDRDRNLKQTDFIGLIKAEKIFGKTAIPYGTYEMVLSFSNRFQKLLPELKDVPGFTGIRWHSGNVASDSEGCMLPGETRSEDFVGNSRKAMNKLMKLIQDRMKREKVLVEVVRG